MCTVRGDTYDHEVSVGMICLGDINDDNRLRAMEAVERLKGYEVSDDPSLPGIVCILVSLYIIYRVMQFIISMYCI